MLAIERQTSPDFVNQVCNHPDVRPTLDAAGAGPVDLSDKIADPHNHFLFGEHGGCAFIWWGAGIYEVHTAVLPAGRGRWATQLTEAVAHWIYTRTDALEVLTRIPEEHHGARLLAQKTGMHEEWRRADGVCFKGKLEPVLIYARRIEDWVRVAPGLEDRGRWLHDRLHSEALRLGVKTPPHENDENHNRYVGAAIEMAMAGQVYKALVTYNRWALLSRHSAVRLLQEKPPVIKMDIGNLKVEDGDIEVILPC